MLWSCWLSRANPTWFFPFAKDWSIDLTVDVHEYFCPVLIPIIITPSTSLVPPINFDDHNEFSRPWVQYFNIIYRNHAPSGDKWHDLSVTSYRKQNRNRGKKSILEEVQIEIPVPLGRPVPPMEVSAHRDTIIAVKEYLNRHRRSASDNVQRAQKKVNPWNRS